MSLPFASRTLANNVTTRESAEKTGSWARRMPRAGAARNKRRVIRIEG